MINRKFIVTETTMIDTRSEPSLLNVLHKGQILKSLSKSKYPNLYKDLRTGRFLKIPKTISVLYLKEISSAEAADILFSRAAI